MFSSIPLPNPNDNHQFKDVMDFFVAMQIRKMQEQQFEEEQKRLSSQFEQEMKLKGPLTAAQTAEAEAKASKAEMLVRLMNEAFGNEGAPSTSTKNMPSEFGAVNKASPEEVENIANESVNKMSSNPNLGQKARDKLIALGVLKESPEDRQKREIETKKGIEEAKGKEKESLGIRSSHKLALSTWNEANKLEKLLKENPNITGLKHSIPGVTKIFGNEKLGEMQGIMGDLQAKVSKYAAARPGIGTIQWASSIKPDIRNNQKYNLGLVKAVKDRIKEEYEEDRKIYKENTGKDLPELSELSDSSDDRITIIDSNGDEHTILKSNLGKARERDSGIRVKGEK